MTTLPPLAVLGAGSMAGAIVRGLIAAGVDPASVAVSTRTAASAEAWRAEGGRAFEHIADLYAHYAAGKRYSAICIRIFFKMNLDNRQRRPWLELPENASVNLFRRFKQQSRLDLHQSRM